jgi:hypothetical protein
MTVSTHPSGRVARRKASYALAISDASDWTDRIDHVQLIESETRVLPAMLQLS